MNDAKRKTLDVIGGHIEEVAEHGGMWITEVGDRDDPNRVFVLVLPAEIGAPLADRLEEQWRLAGGGVLDNRYAQDN
jgi:hypothetical protein